MECGDAAAHTNPATLAEQCAAQRSTRLYDVIYFQALCAGTICAAINVHGIYMSAPPSAHIIIKCKMPPPPTCSVRLCPSGCERTIACFWRGSFIAGKNATPPRVAQCVCESVNTPVSIKRPTRALRCKEQLNGCALVFG